jgi:AhpD family alkylhydroperoxidase
MSVVHNNKKRSKTMEATTPMPAIPSIPAERIKIGEPAMKPLASMIRLDQSLEVETRVLDLIHVRASQVNGCANCIDMHWKDARAHGETEERLYALDAWRESPLYEERERAALDLCEAMTLIRDGHVPDPVWNRAAAAFDEKELIHLVFAIASINSWNRLNITVRIEPGHYQPGMLEDA